MGFGIMQYWINGPATDGIDDKIKMAYILLIRLRRTIILDRQNTLTLGILDILGNLGIHIKGFRYYNCQTL